MNKTNIFLFTIIFCSLTAVAQDEPAENIRDPRAREKIRAAHAAYITQRLELTSPEAERFWPVYREYGEKRRVLRQPLREERSKGADEQELLDLDLKIKQQELDLEIDYMQRFQKIISAQKLLKLRQAEVDFRKLILRQIQLRHRRRR
jgi:hypothetical protein